jgi:thiol-disulfide isomerase/thioredoxin
MIVMVGCRGNASAPRLAFPFRTAAASKTLSGADTSMPRIDLPKQRVRAPEFPREFAWVNTNRPLFIQNDLKGCVVVLDFWTYCCINCMHVLPDLEYIEHKYEGQPVMIVGVHSAKFDNEGDKDHILEACQRYNVAHPVIVDENHEIWSQYGVNSWPTLMVIDPEGRIVGSLSGEGNRAALDAVIHSLLEEGQQKGTLAAAPPKFERKSRVPSASGLAFPGKILAESGGKYLFISDSNHDRVIVSSPGGNVIAIAGSGRKGQADGAFPQAEFDNPQGMAFDASANVLYVADTDNHLIRKLDLNAKTVTTISGTGEQVYDREGGGSGRNQGLNSPWDLALVDGQLYIAMAGPHQLWVLDLTTGVAKAWVGSGREDILDSPGLSAALAQPSGMIQKGDWLYWADSEVSAVRRVNIKTRKVETLVGTGLFDFGDKDGDFGDALFQHPLGVTVYGDDILVADTYNSKIKRLDENSHRVSTIAGDGHPQAIASATGELSLYEPGGLSARGDTLYIADTNHDGVVVYDLKNGTWHELTLKGLRVETARHMETANVPVKEVRVKPGSDLTLRIGANFAKGIHLNREAPINYAFTPSANDSGDGAVEGIAKYNQFPVEFTVPAAAVRIGETYQTMVSIAYCTDENEGLCVPVTLNWRLKLNADPTASDVVELTESIQPMH